MIREVSCPAELVRRVFRGTRVREVSCPAEPVRRVFRGTRIREVSDAAAGALSEKRLLRRSQAPPTSPALDPQ
jgi:hypothetical protein